MLDIQIKRVYDKSEETDGLRVLVDRLWPRGIRKVDLSFDEWAKYLAPSTAARNEFAHKPENFERFKTRYRQELDINPEAHVFVERLKTEKPSRLTLLYAAKDPNINHATILADWLRIQLKRD